MILYLGLIIVSFNLFATTEVSESNPSGVGPGKAVLEATKNDGFRLAKIAFQNLEVITSPILVSGSIKLPISSLVYSQSDVGVYRFRSGWFKYVKIKVISKTAKGAVVQSSEIRLNDHVAIQGGDLLRLADLNIWSGEEGE